MLPASQQIAVRALSPHGREVLLTEQLELRSLVADRIGEQPAYLASHQKGSSG